jgi:hypothetical protein
MDNTVTTPGQDYKISAKAVNLGLHNTLIKPGTRQVATPAKPYFFVRFFLVQYNKS